MSGRKPIIPQEERQDISPSNKEWFEKYVNYSGNPKGYYGPVKEFLEFCEFTDSKLIPQLTVDDIAKYVDVLKKHDAKQGTINTRYSAIASFRDYLIKEHNFDEKFLANFPKHEKIIENPKDFRPLNLRQLAFARKYNRRKSGSVKDEYVFELFFQTGIDKDDLSEQNYPNIENTQLKNLIEKIHVAGERVSIGAITSYFQRLTKYLKKQGIYDLDRRDINSYDLVESHKSYFQKCPNCGRGPFEKTSGYWVLAKIRFDNERYDDEYHLVCVVCKGGPNE